jgi:hypothetical protein
MGAIRSFATAIAVAALFYFLQRSYNELDINSRCHIKEIRSIPRVSDSPKLDIRYYVGDVMLGIDDHVRYIDTLIIEKGGEDLINRIGVKIGEISKCCSSYNYAFFPLIWKWTYGSVSNVVNSGTKPVITLGECQ